MNKKIRWALSIVTGVATVPAGYAASVMLCGPNSFGTFLAMTNALALIP